MAAYYNEWDKSAAAWLRELIADGQLPSGDVDERSILDVTADDIRGYTQCHFFAGIGGWAYALRLAGWPDDRPAWTGSPPCQPFSAAGLGEGEFDERHLWPSFYGLIRTFSPPVIFGEQVASKLIIGQVGKRKPSRKAGSDHAEQAEWAWIDAVFDDLEAARYACGSLVVPACSIGTFHKRDRLWFVARSCLDRRGLDESGELADSSTRQQQRHSGGILRMEQKRQALRCQDREASPEQCGTDSQMSGYFYVGDLANPNSQRYDRQHTLLRQREEGSSCFEIARRGETLQLANPASLRCDEQRPTEGTAIQGQCAERTGQHTEPGHSGQLSGGFEGLCGDGVPAGGFDALGNPQHDRHHRGAQRGSLVAGEIEGRLLQPERPGFWDAIDWLPCKDGRHRPVEPGTFPLVNGLPRGMVPSGDPCEAEAKSTGEARQERLKGYGNAIVPELAAEFILSCLEAGVLEMEGF